MKLKWERKLEQESSEKVTNKNNANIEVFRAVYRNQTVAVKVLENTVSSSTDEIKKEFGKKSLCVK